LHRGLTARRPKLVRELEDHRVFVEDPLPLAGLVKELHQHRQIRIEVPEEFVGNLRSVDVGAEVGKNLIGGLELCVAKAASAREQEAVGVELQKHPRLAQHLARQPQALEEGVAEVREGHDLRGTTERGVQTKRIGSDRMRCHPDFRGTWRARELVYQSLLRRVG